MVNSTADQTPWLRTEAGKYDHIHHRDWNERVNVKLRTPRIRIRMEDDIFGPKIKLQVLSVAENVSDKNSLRKHKLDSGPPTPTRPLQDMLTRVSHRQEWRRAITVASSRLSPRRPDRERY